MDRFLSLTLSEHAVPVGDTMCSNQLFIVPVQNSGSQSAGLTWKINVGFLNHPRFHRKHCTTLIKHQKNVHQYTNRLCTTTWMPGQFGLPYGTDFRALPTTFCQGQLLNLAQSLCPIMIDENVGVMRSILNLIYTHQWSWMILSIIFTFRRQNRYQKTKENMTMNPFGFTR